MIYGLGRLQVKSLPDGAQEDFDRQSVCPLEGDSR